MFGFGPDPKLVQKMAGIIGAAGAAFDRSIDITAGLRNCDAPPIGDKYLGVILGFAEHAARMYNASDAATSKALDTVLTAYQDGAGVHRRIKLLRSLDGQINFRMWARQALSRSNSQETMHAAMMELAESYFDR